MKSLKHLTLAISILVSSISVTFSQTSTVGMGQEFKQLSGEIGARNTGFEGIQTYNNPTVKGSQFFYPAWSRGAVTTNNNQVISDNYLFIFDKVRQLLFIKEADKINSNDPNDVLTVDQSKIVLFTLNIDKPHNFVKAMLYDSALSGKFFEILIQSENYSLFKLTQTTFERADHQDIMEVKNGNMADQFVDHTTYYIYHNHQLQKITLHESNIRKVLSDNKPKVNDYFSLHGSDAEINEDFLVGLVNSLN